MATSSPARKTITPPARKTIAPPATNTTSLADSAAVVERTEGDQVNLTTVDTASDEVVTAIVPKPFKLTRDDRTEVEYLAGTQEMPEADATHWFARAVGVKIYKPKG